MATGIDEFTSGPLTTADAVDTIDPSDGDCDVFIQDCPKGQKCAWVDSGKGWPDRTACVPLARRPLPDGAPCQADWDSFLMGLDDCERGSYCLDDDGLCDVFRSGAGSGASWGRC